MQQYGLGGRIICHSIIVQIIDSNFKIENRDISLREKFELSFLMRWNLYMICICLKKNWSTY